jgi:pimeloyl-ACP methyl ester carboxylesterase
MTTPIWKHARGPALIFSTAVTLIALLGPLNTSNSVAADSARVARPTIVLEHGAWADGSSWSGVVESLQARGFTVLVPPNPLRGTSEDSAYLASYLQTISGPIVLAGHSYGGIVITNAALNNPNVKALVYVDAYIPDVGQNLLDLTAGSCLGGGGDPSKVFRPVPSAGGVDLYLQIAANPAYLGFAQCFANGVDRDEIGVLGAVQRPVTFNVLGEPSGPPAWQTIPSWSLIGTADHVIPPDQQEAMSSHAQAHITTFNAGHLGLITRPDAVAATILDAVRATT